MQPTIRPESSADHEAIRLARDGDRAEWLRMRSLLWPDSTAAEHAEEIAAYFDTGRFGWSEPFLAVATFVAVRPDGGLCGFLEASIRPYAEDCVTRPAGYVEGWFVDADQRCQGVGKGLMAAAERWAAARGCWEMASDAHPENKVSLVAHAALSFEESSRSVHLRKWIPGTGGRTKGRGTVPRRLNLVAVRGTFAVCRLGHASPIPAWAAAGDFFMITRTADELSVVCRQEIVPEGIPCERDWRCVRVAGAMPFSTVGVLAALTAPLSDVGISVFAFSTFDTDYLLVKEQDWEAAVNALRRRGHNVAQVCDGR